MKSLSHVQLFVTPWAVACQAPPSMGFSRQEYWSGLPFPSPGDLPDPGIEPGSPMLQADSLTSEPPGKSLADMVVSGEAVSQEGACVAQPFRAPAGCGLWPRGHLLGAQHPLSHLLPCLQPPDGATSARTHTTSVSISACRSLPRPFPGRLADS